MSLPILVTGAAGFIGMHVARRLLADGRQVVGIDNLNDYYDVRLKEARLAQLAGSPKFEFLKLDLADRTAMPALFREYQFETVVHLAAQPGVRYSLKNPHAYVDSNLVGFTNILEGCRHGGVKHLMYASSSSVYGGNTKLPFAETDRVDNQVSFYGATKKANELMAHTYTHLYGLPTTGLRFFTVYGPWGRPDMAAFQFADAIQAGRPIQVFNQGNMERDFTYIDDVVEGVVRLVSKPEGYKLYNIGNHSPVKLTEFIAILEELLGKTANKELLPLQAGDVPATYADVDALHVAIGFAPATPLREGLAHFVAWYTKHYGKCD